AIAAGTTATARSGLTQPDDVGVRLIGKQCRRDGFGRAIANAEDDNQGKNDVRKERAGERGGNSLLLLLEEKRDLCGMSPFHVKGQMPGRLVYADFWCRGFGHRECYGTR